MKDWVIDDDNLSIERKSILPGEGFFVPDSVEEAKEEAEAEAALTGAEVAVVADPDADGLACTALVREIYGEAALIDAGPHDLEEALERVADYSEPGARIFVCDLCPDSYDEVGESLEALVEQAGDVRWFDHHQWTDPVDEAVREAGVELVVGDSDEECTADVAVRSLDYDFPDYLVELAAVTRDHDLWIRDDERSDDLADFSYWADPEEYIEVVAEHGADLPADIEEFLAEMRVEKDALIEKAVARADVEEIGPWTVGVTYGRCSQNEVAEELRQQGTDAAVVVKPSGSASIRGTDEFERCHEVARQVNGGGHPKAAGCKPRIYDDMLDYAHHWTTRGAVAKQVIVEAFWHVARDVEAETAAAEEELDEGDEAGENDESDE
ncbi:recombinase RecJ [Halorussus gelatinilyticus]|uniref:Recombinase RecJ n=1 Tax=Halorussus gelatinilyticus TaxID=2937524 RepID=A0A8U0ILY5_9EURY|nr:recombinase RecJ [Halorussus gelatinilyticus]UPW02147.1 recombinase RecJ [Halorussus gelatinilyticus]